MEGFHDPVLHLLPFSFPSLHLVLHLLQVHLILFSLLFSLSVTGIAFKENVDLKTFLLFPCAHRRARTL